MSTRMRQSIRWIMVGFFEDLPSERAIAARCADSMSIRAFLKYDLNEKTPEHSSFTVIRQRLGLEIHCVNGFLFFGCQQLACSAAPGLGLILNVGIVGLCSFRCATSISRVMLTIDSSLTTEVVEPTNQKPHRPEASGVEVESIGKAGNITGWIACYGIHPARPPIAAEGSPGKMPTLREHSAGDPYRRFPRAIFVSALPTLPLRHAARSRMGGVAATPRVIP
jgi:hypothetical protein